MRKKSISKVAGVLVIGLMFMTVLQMLTTERFAITNALGISLNVYAQELSPMAEKDWFSYTHYSEDDPLVGFKVQGEVVYRGSGWEIESYSVIPIGEGTVIENYKIIGKYDNYFIVEVNVSFRSGLQGIVRVNIGV